jgi:hypothetical protein
MSKNINKHIDACPAELAGNKKDMRVLNCVERILLDTTNMPVNICRIISEYALVSIYARTHSKLLSKIGISLEAKSIIVDKYVNSIIRVGECLPYFDIWKPSQKPYILIVYRNPKTFRRMVSMWDRYVDASGQTRYTAKSTRLENYWGLSNIHLAGMKWCGLIPIELCKITIAMDGYITSKTHWSIEDPDIENEHRCGICYCDTV